MRTIQTLILILSFAMLSSAQTPEQSIAKLESLLPEVGARDLELRQAAQAEWLEVCNSMQKPLKPFREALCVAMSDMLERKRTKLPAKVFICRNLERLGRDESVDALAKLLHAEQAGEREAARRALASNPSPRAGDALISRYEKAEKLQEQRAIIHALGFRAEPKSIALLSSTAETAKGPLLISAVSALGNVASSEEVPANLLRKGYDKDALLRLADRLAAEGKTRAALAIYRPIAKNQHDSGFGAAAFRGLLEHDKGNAQALLEEAFTGDSKIRRQIATAAFRNAPDDTALAIVKKLNTLPVAGQLSVLNALGKRSDGVFRAEVKKYLDSTNSQVRLAAVGAFGPLEDPWQLTRLLAHDDAEIAEAAKQTIARMPGNSIDELLVPLTSAFEPGSTEYVTVLDLLNSRRVTAAIPAFVEALGSNDEKIRQKATNAISRLGTNEDVSALLRALLNQKGLERDRTEKQVVSMCRRLDASSVVTFYEAADTQGKRQLLPLLGRIGDESSLTTIRKSLRSSEQAEVEAAVAALANWPNNEVASDLRAQVKSSAKTSQRIRAQRALARVSVLGGSDEEKLDHLKFVFDSATRPDEKILALERAKAVRTVESLQFVLPHITDAKLGERAQRTVVDLAHHRGLREPNREVFEPALKRVMKLLKDSRQIERAEKYLANE